MLEIYQVTLFTISSRNKRSHVALVKLPNAIHLELHLSSQVTKLITFETLQVLLLQQNVDTFLDIRNFGYEAVLDLLNHLTDQLCVLHRFA